MTDEDI